jgi:hypothetical protein
VFSTATGGLLGPVAKGHFRDTFWCLQRWNGVHQCDNHSYFLWFPSLDAFGDLGTEDYMSDVRWHRICDDSFDSSNPSVEDMTDTEDVRMQFASCYFFYNLRGATLLAKMAASEVGGAYEFAPSPEELTTVPDADIRACALSALSANPVPTEVCSSRTLSGEAGDELIFWNGSVGAVTRFGLIAWLGSRAHVDDKTWPLEVGSLAAGNICPSGANLLTEWSVCFEYKGVSLKEPITMSLPPDLASMARRLHDWMVVRDGAMRDHLREVLTEASTFALSSTQPVCSGLVPPALMAHIVSADALTVIPSGQICPCEWAGPGRSPSSPVSEWLSASTREFQPASTRGVARRAHPEKLVSNRAAAIAAFRLRKPSAAAGDGAAASGFVGLGNLTTPLASVVMPLDEIDFQLLSIVEFEKLIPLALPVDEPVARRSWLRSQSRPIWCDVLGGTLFLHGDTFVIKTALKQAGFMHTWNPAVKRWEHRWLLQLAQTAMSWRLGSIVITFTPAVEARARREL